MSQIPSKQDMVDAKKRIDNYVHNTPILTSGMLNSKAGANIYFKCENFQKMGAFKMRGATNAIAQLTNKQKEKGVVTHSSGNFAQALSLAAKSLGVKAYIVMPENAPSVKKEAVKGYGGEIIECASTLEAREQTAKEVEEEKGATFIHPSDNLEVIIGQGTAAMELLEEYPYLDYIFSPVGGGGLIAGTALAAQYFSDHAKVIGGEPSEADDAYRSLKSGKIESNESALTIADGLRTMLGEYNFPIIYQMVDEIILVEEDEIVTAMQLIWERMKIIVEPSSAVAFAAVLKEQDRFENKNIGIIISGGNVDLSNLPF